jgi:8-oxo-dGTP diphosphatase
MIRRTRVSGLLVRDNKILVVEHQKGDKKYYLLPGGGINEGETVELALQREFIEETGLEIEIARLLFLSDTIYPDKSKQIHHLIFQVKEDAPNELSVSQDERVKQALWVDYKKLSELEFYPPLSDWLIKYLDGKLSGYGAIYLGKLWK